MRIRPVLVWLDCSCIWDTCRGAVCCGGCGRLTGRCRWQTLPQTLPIWVTGRPTSPAVEEGCQWLGDAGGPVDDYPVVVLGSGLGIGVDEEDVALLQIATDADFDEGDVTFVSAFEDRDRDAFRQSVGELDWASFAWFASEPDNIVRMHGGDPVSLSRLSELMLP